MRSLNKAYVWIAAVLIFLLVGGMILTTVLLARSEQKQWSYYSSDDTFDYYSTETSSKDFQYVNNFKHALYTYFDSLINDKLSTYFNVESLMEKYLEKIAERAVNAMASARVPAVKLNKIAEYLSNNSLGSFYNAFKEFVSQFDTYDEMEAYIFENIGDYTIFSIFRDSLSGLMRETGITENEIARFIYYYLLQNSDKTYVTYMELIGEEFFVRLVSNTIYVMVTIGDISNSRYLSESTAYSARSVVYQLGSLYVGIGSLPGGGETLERILHTNREYDETYGEYVRMNELSEKMKGKIGDFIILLGYFMRNIEPDDISSYFAYVEEEDEQAKKDAMIYSAWRFARRFDDALVDVYGNEGGRIERFIGKYTGLLDDMCELSVLMIHEISDNDDEIPVEPSTEFFTFGNACIALCENNYTPDEIRQMDKEGEDYAALLYEAESFFQFKVAISSMISYTLLIWSANEINTYIKAAASSLAEKEV